MASETAPARDSVPAAAPSSNGSLSALTHCPTCGARRTRPDSTLCAYCATPFDLVAPRPARAENPNLARLARMPEQPGYAEAAAWQPLESLEHQKLDARKRRGVHLLVAAALLAGVALFSVPSVALAGAALVGLAGLWLVLAARRGQARILAQRLLLRPAIVLDRRSETAMGFWNGETVYFFTLEFADGSDGEFRWPGRGVDHQPLVNGATGLAFTRGDVLLGFRAIRV